VTGYRVQVLWMPRGALIGAAAGAAVGAVATAGVVLADEATSGGVWELVAGTVAFGGLGAFAGAVLGAVVGFVAGIPLVFLVGQHLPLATARRRAFVSGLVLPPAGMAVAFAGMSGDWSMLATWWDHPVSSLLANSVFLAPSLVGAPLAAWAAGKDLRMPRPPVS
jgi:hypothetical protein